MKWFTRWSDALNERQEFQFGELLSFNPEYDCLHLTLPVPRSPGRQHAAQPHPRRPRENDANGS